MFKGLAKLFKKGGSVKDEHIDIPSIPPLDTIAVEEGEAPKKVGANKKWQVVYNGKYRNHGQTHVITDGFGFSPKGEYSIAYLSAHYESWRPDAKNFNLRGSKALGKWKGEKYIDWRHPENLTVMRKRIAMVKKKGYHAIDWDNVDSGIYGYGLKKVNGKPYNLDYLRWLIKETHAAGLGCGLKNFVEALPYVHEHVEFAVSEASSKNEMLVYKKYDIHGVHMGYGAKTYHLYRVRNGSSGNKY
jgi:hypothetical protein